MIDLHCHILYDVDDGPSELDESLELCRIACSNNIDRIVATPHILDISEAEDLLSRRDSRIKELKNALDQLDLKIDLLPGAEVLVNDEIFYANCLEQLTINHSRYLLIEFPYSGLNLNSLRRYIKEILGRGLIPIIAHPERYTYFQRDYEMVNILIRDGALLQVNAASLCKKENRAEYKLAKNLVRQRAASFLATDAHSVDFRPNNLLDMLFCIPPEINYDYINDMVNLNPETILDDKILSNYVG